MGLLSYICSHGTTAANVHQTTHSHEGRWVRCLVQQQLGWDGIRNLLLYLLSHCHGVLRSENEHFTLLIQVLFLEIFASLQSCNPRTTVIINVTLIDSQQISCKADWHILIATLMKRLVQSNNLVSTHCCIMWYQNKSKQSNPHTKSPYSHTAALSFNCISVQINTKSGNKSEGGWVSCWQQQVSGELSGSVCVRIC